MGLEIDKQKWIKHETDAQMGLELLIKVNQTWNRACTNEIRIYVHPTK